jgi:hypothetical protein
VHIGYERALPGRTRELLQQHDCSSKVVLVRLRQSLSARQQITEGTLVYTIAHGEAVRDAFVACLQQLGHLLRAEPELASACSTSSR